MAVEPNIKSLPEHLLKENIQFSSLENALEVANIVVILVDHQEFKIIDKTLLATKVVIDTRGIF